MYVLHCYKWDNITLYFSLLRLDKRLKFIGPMSAEPWDQDEIASYPIPFFVEFKPFPKISMGTRFSCSPLTPASMEMGESMALSATWKLTPDSFFTFTTHSECSSVYWIIVIQEEWIIFQKHDGFRPNTTSPCSLNSGFFNGSSRHRVLSITLFPPCVPHLFPPTLLLHPYPLKFFSSFAGAEKMDLPCYK